MKEVLLIVQGGINLKRLEILPQQVFGRLSVLNEIAPLVTKRGKEKMFLCKCDCGNLLEVRLRCLTSGQTQSCGCLCREISSIRNKKYNIYETDGEVTKVFDDKGNFTLIDTEDLDKVEHNYYSLHTKGYFVDNYNGVKLHHLITNCPDNMVVDHINHDKTDNRKCNLRVCTVQQNNMNNLCKGYSFHNTIGKWASYINFNGERKHLGYFETEKEAKNARELGELKYFGDFRCRVKENAIIEKN